MSFNYYLPQRYFNFDENKMPEETKRYVNLEFGNIMFAGKNRTGKSFLSCHLLKKAVDKVIDTGKYPDYKWLSAFDLGAIFLEAFSTHGERKKINELCSYEFLVIDDLGKYKLTQRVCECLFALIEKRVSPTIINTNLDGKDFLSRSEDKYIAKAILGRIHDYYKIVKL